MSSIDEQFIDFIVKSLVSNPDAVKVQRTIDEKGVLLELTVDPEDLGRVIGKRGATAQSLRTLLRALGTKNDARYNLKIVDNGPGPEARAQAQNDAAAADDSASDDTTVAASDDALDQETESLDTITAQEEAPIEDDEEVDEESALARKTRKELAEFDDLDL
jgi:predicted RNA-binding protein YlqC (UPF0109 family)